jgi:hypothetical protein
MLIDNLDNINQNQYKMFHQLKESFEHLTTYLGWNPHIGLVITVAGVISGVALEATPANSHPHPMQMVSWIVASLVGLGTILALIKTHTTLFDKIKWVKNKK